MREIYLSGINRSIWKKKRSKINADKRASILSEEQQEKEKEIQNKQ